MHVPNPEKNYDLLLFIIYLLDLVIIIINCVCSETQTDGYSEIIKS